MEEEDSTINAEVTTMVNRVAACMAVNYTMKVEIQHMKESELMMNSINNDNPIGAPLSNYKFRFARW